MTFLNGFLFHFLFPHTKMPSAWLQVYPFSGLLRATTHKLVNKAGNKYPVTWWTKPDIIHVWFKVNQSKSWQINANSPLLSYVPWHVQGGWSWSERGPSQSCRGSVSPFPRWPSTWSSYRGDLLRWESSSWRGTRTRIACPHRTQSHHGP